MPRGVVLSRVRHTKLH